MIPDRSNDTVRTEPVADEVDLANVIRLEKRIDTWVASVGPRGRGLCGWGATPRHAVEGLFDRAEFLGWTFDDTWRERP